MKVVDGEGVDQSHSLPINEVMVINFQESSSD